MTPDEGTPAAPPGQSPEDIEMLLAAIPEPPVPRHLAQTLVNGLPVGVGAAAGAGLSIAAWSIAGGVVVAACIALVVMFGPRTTPRASHAGPERPDPATHFPMVIQTESISTNQIILKDTNPCRTHPSLCN